MSMFVACGGGGGTKTQPPVTLPATIPVTGPTVAGAEHVDENVTALLRKWNVPGAAVAVAKNGKLVLARGYGYSDLEAQRPMQPDAMFRIGSTSKVLTAVAILQLVEQGKLSLDAKFLDVLTDYTLPANADARLRIITIRNLLQHSGGWDRQISGDPIDRQVEIARALGVTAPAGCSDMIRYMLGKPLDFDPGTRWAYSNFGYCILGRVVEKVSSEKYELYVRNHILEPIGIHGMYIGTSRQGRQGQYEVKYYDPTSLVPSVFPGEGSVPMQYGGFEMLDAPGGWIGSPIDLVRFMTALDGSRTNSLLKPETMALMTANPGLPGTGPGWWYGFALFVGPSPDLWCHGGSIPGSETQLCRDPNGYVYAIISNSRTASLPSFAPELEAVVPNALTSGFGGSTTDLFPQFPSPVMPPSSQ
jgi:N-acyl-D-amino-acid deacylase